MDTLYPIGEMVDFPLRGRENFRLENKAFFMCSEILEDEEFWTHAGLAHIDLLLSDFFFTFKTKFLDIQTSYNFSNQKTNALFSRRFWTECFLRGMDSRMIP